MSTRFSVAALLGGALLLCAPPARADAVLAPASHAAPAVLDLQVAVANGTRWTRVHGRGPARVMWLVPARPGAAIDWAPDAWLDALDDATAPRVTSPDASPPCGMPGAAERVETLGARSPAQSPTEIVVHATESAARAHVAARGFVVTPEAAGRVAQIYASGGALASLELDAVAGEISTPTLRVSDGGPRLLPLALTGSAHAATNVTAFVIADAALAVDGMTDLDVAQLSWGRSRSTYAPQRAALVSSGAWLRESASHEALFAGYPVPRGEPVAAALDVYFQRTNGAWASCSSATHAVGWMSGAVVGRSCAPGAVARLPGGAACAPESGPVDPAALTCGRAMDLALALSGIAPARATVTRLSGTVPRASLAADLALSASYSVRSPVYVASRYDACAVAPAEPDVAPGAGSSGPALVSATTSEGCGGTTTTTTTEEPDTTTATATETTSSSSCSGDTTTSSTSSESASSSADDGGGCGGDSSSSKKSESDSSSSSDDGWDKEDASSSDSCGSSTSDAGAKQAKRRTSRVSRYAMLLAFLVLPVRRRLRRLR